MRLFCTLITIFAMSAGAHADTSANDDSADNNTSPTFRSIKVRANIELTSQNEISLGDLADFEGFSEKELLRLKGVNIADAPKVGEVRSFTDVGLTQIFRNYLKPLEGADYFRLTIPARVTVTKKPFKLERADIEKELRTRFAENCRTCEFDFTQINLPIVAKDLEPSTKWKIKVRPELPRGNFSVPLEITTNDFAGTESVKKYWITGQVETRKEVAVAKRNIAMGEKLGESDFAFEKKDITFVTDTTPDLSELKTSYAARTIMAEQVIGRSALRRESAMRFGDTVKVVAGNDSWQVSVDGVAQQNAYVGEVVKVKILRSQKEVSGLLIDKGVVEIR